jgi:hypothetical protein
MLAASVALWLTLDAAFRPLFVYPGYRNGLDLSGGFRLAHAVRPGLELAVAGRTGATFVDGWRPLFEGRAELIVERLDVELRAGLRHDDRLRREGALADFRDPTGRIFLGAGIFPLRRGWFSAGAALDYERALPGSGRLPSAVSLAAVGRLRWRTHP